MKSNSKIIVVIMTILIIIGIGYYFLFAESGIQETPTEFGSFGQQVNMKYDDDSIAPLDVTHSGKTVTYVNYVLSAKNTYSQLLNIDLSDYSVEYSIGGNTYNNDFTETSLTVSPTGEFIELVNVDVDINSIIGSLTSGTYTLSVVPSGIITYSFNGDTAKECNLPSSVSNSVTIDSSIESYTLDIIVNGQGTVTQVPAGPTYAVGTTVTLTANALTGYEFLSWVGTSSATTNPTTVLMNNDKTITVTFQTQSSSDYEDLSTYVEGDDSSDYLTLVGNNAVRATAMPRDAASYLQKSRPIGNGDFTLEYDFTATTPFDSNEEGSVGGTIGIGILSSNENIKTWQDVIDSSSGIVISLRAYTQDSVNYWLLQCKSYDTDTYNEFWAALNTEYHIKLSRISGNLRFQIYNGETIVRDWSTTDGTNIQYYIPLSGRDGLGAETMVASGVVENIKFS